METISLTEQELLLSLALIGVLFTALCCLLFRWFVVEVNSSTRKE